MYLCICIAGPERFQVEILEAGNDKEGRSKALACHTDDSKIWGFPKITLSVLDLSLKAEFWDGQWEPNA